MCPQGPIFGLSIRRTPTFVVPRCWHPGLSAPEKEAMATLFALKDRFTVLTLNECPWGFSEQAKSPCGSNSGRILPTFGSQCGALSRLLDPQNGAFFRLVSPHVANPLLIRMDLMCNRNELIPIDHAHLSFLLPNLASRSSSRPFRTSSWETSTSGETRHMAFEHWCASRTRTSSQRPSKCHDMNIILNIGWR